MTARLERCTESDIEALRAISMETFVEAFGEQNTTEDMEQYLRTTLSQGALLAELQTAGSEFYLAIVDGMVAGYLKINTGSAQNEAMGERALEVERIYTTCKGQGLGALMMNHAIAIAHERELNTVWLGVWEHNGPALGFYRHLGFEQFGEHSFMLGSDLQTDLLMELTVSVSAKAANGRQGV